MLKNIDFTDQMISLNGHTIQATFQMFHIQTYLMILLGVGSKESLLKWQASGCYDDQDLSQLDAGADGADSNLKLRYNRFKGGKSITLRGPLLRFVNKIEYKEYGSMGV